MWIFYDVDTQKDFMNSDGALYIPDAEVLKPNLRTLTQFALENAILILGSVDRHFGSEERKDAEIELARWGGLFPDHCMDGTEGQKKIPETFIDGCVYIPSEWAGYVKLESLELLPQIIFEKQSYNVFHDSENPGGNHNIGPFLRMKGVKEAIIYGVATDYCVKAAALGFKVSGVHVYVVSDAIKAVNPETEEEAREKMVNAGVKFVTTSQVLEGKLNELPKGC